MIARTTRILLEVVVGIAALGAIVAGVLVWRVAQGPVALDFLTPRLQAALSQGSGEFDVRLGGTVLAWEGWPETFALRVTDVRVAAAGRTVAEVPSINLRLSLSALVSGTVAPTEVTGRGARLVVVRGPGGFRFGRPATAPEAAGPDGGGEQDISRVVPALLDDLMASPTPQRPLSYLERLEVQDASLLVHDRLLNVVWRAPDAAIRLRRAPDGIDGDARLTLQLAGTEVAADASLSYMRGSGSLDLVAGFDGLHPAALAAKVPALADAKGIEVPLSGTVSASLALSGGITSASAVLTGGAGRVAWPTYLPTPQPVRGLDARLHYTATGSQVRLEQLRVDFGGSGDDTETGAGSDGDAKGAPKGAEQGPVVTVSAGAGGFGGATEVEARMTVEGLALSDLGSYWPIGLGGNARPWVLENIRNGRAEKAELEARLTIPAGEPKTALDAVQLQHLDGRISYSGLDVHYLRPLPPVRSLDGTARFDADSLHLSPRDGELGNLQVPEAQIDITGLDTTDHDIAIDLRLGGPLREALNVLDQPRLDLIEPLGLSPAAVSGTIQEARLRFGFPLIEELTFEQTEVSAQASLAGVGVQDFVLGQDARDGRFDLSVDKRGMTVDGPVELGGVPLTMSWQENFAADAPVTSTMQATVPRLEATDRAQLGLDTRPYLDGPVSASVLVRTYGGGDGLVNASVNLQEAALEVPFAAWRKPTGAVGTANASLRLRDGRPSALESFTVEAGGGGMVDRLAATGSVRFGSGGGLAAVDLAQFRLGRTDLQGMRVERRPDAWRLSLQDGVLDLRRLLGEGMLRGGEDAGAPAKAQPAIEIETSRLDRVYFADRRYVEKVNLSARRGGDGWWQRLRIDGQAPAGFRRTPRADGSLPPVPEDAASAAFEVHYRPGPDGRRRLNISAEDSGAMLRALDVYDNVEGGHMEITGAARGPSPASPVDADIEITDFKLVRVPTLAKILTVASFTGINDLLKGEGIGFQRLDGTAVYDRGTLSSELLHAYGPALGVTAKGDIDLDARTLDLNGVVVPAASTNRVLGSIPVLGTLLTGGEGEGLFAVSYSVEGSLEAPKVDVNPLSALAPGFLRGLFGKLGELKGKPLPEDWPQAGPQGRN